MGGIRFRAPERETLQNDAGKFSLNPPTSESSTDSPLYRTISRRAELSDGLKLTNILATDPIYKHIAILWLDVGSAKVR